MGGVNPKGLKCLAGLHDWETQYTSKNLKGKTVEHQKCSKCGDVRTK